MGLLDKPEPVQLLGLTERQRLIKQLKDRDMMQKSMGLMSSFMDHNLTNNRLGQNITPGDIAKTGMDFSPVVGDAIAVDDSINYFKNDQPGMGLLSGLGAIPILGMAGDAIKPVAKKIKGLLKNADLPMDEASRMQRAKDMGFDVDTTYYHGTSADFDEFDVSKSKDMGLHFGTKEQAAEFGDRVLPVHLKIKNPLKLDFDPTVVDIDSFYDGDYYKSLMDRVLYETGEYDILNEVRSGNKIAEKVYDKAMAADRKIAKLLARGDERDVFGLKEIKDYQKSMQNYLSSKGYDAINYENELEGLSGDIGRSIAVFNNDQIRSKFAKFDPKMKSSANLLAGGLLGATALGALAPIDDR